jgi:hypothetical protein
MPAQTGGARPAAADYFPPEVVRMLATARAAIDTHLHGVDGCVGCGRR